MNLALLGLVGPYISWALSGWFPQDSLASTEFGKREKGTQFALVAGIRVHHLAFEAWHAPPMSSGMDVRGIDAKMLFPIGDYVTPYARLRIARMVIHPDLDDDKPPLTGLGEGAAVGLQVQFPGRMFGILIPAWFAAPFGLRGIGGIYAEVGAESYVLTPGSRERFWRFAYGVAWGAAF